VTSAIDLSMEPNGAVSLQVFVVDNVGNVSMTESATVLIDRDIPMLTASQLTPGYDVTPTVGGASNQPDGVEVRVTTIDGENMCSALTNSGAWQCDISTTMSDSERLLLASVSDVGGTTTEETFVLLVGANVDLDADGIPDIVERDADFDLDGIADFLDTDADDFFEREIDGDFDGQPNYLDVDSDNDGIYDYIEAGIETAMDTNSDGQIEGIVSANGALDHLETSVDSGELDLDGDGITDIPLDTDNDSVLDLYDIDSDNDGIVDLLEHHPDLARVDLNGDGRVDNFIDDDSNGMHDTVTGITNTVADSDADGLADFRDVDADGDGIGDILESGSVDADSNGVIDGFIDANNDGMHDPLRGVGVAELDTDRDGIVNRLDLDSDYDGLTDAVEGILDNDGDGIPNYLDSAVLDAIPVPDLDGDGIANSADTDLDGDGISNTLEGIVDTDGDGLPDLVDTDSDADGIPDAVESVADADSDGASNYVDTDSDGDGIDDAIEGLADTDQDGVNNYLDVDADGDGIHDAIEGDGDLDIDGLANYLDLDSDGDVTPDQFEPDDADGSGVLDFLEFGTGADSDNDGIADSVEGVADEDSDGLPNYIDLDADGDGIADSSESSFDQDNDGVPNFLDHDADGDEIPDSEETALDSDGDSIPNYLDLDSDGDAIADERERALDTDGDGLINALDLDSDADGISDSVETDYDYDGDGLYNAIDLDSDNDGLADRDESLDIVTEPIVASQGILSRFRALLSSAQNDSSLDDPVAVVPFDGDGDLVPDYIDIDSDNDAIPDSIEAGTIDIDLDGRVDSFIDQNRNGWHDPLENAVFSFRDTDGDGLPDHRDIDSDQDGLPDIVEVMVIDEDGNGRVDNFVDNNFDGMSDEFIFLPVELVDTDGDSIPNYREVDSDGDSLFDLVEIGGQDVDGDGLVDSLLDTDGDGIPDVVDANQTGGNDADGDSIDDRFDASFVAGGDIDLDGIIDAADPDADGDGFAEQMAALVAGELPDANGDNIPDYLQSSFNGIVQTGTLGNGIGCSIVSPKSNGNNPLILLLGVLAFLRILWREPKLCCDRQLQASRRPNKIVLIFALAAGYAGVSNAANENGLPETSRSNNMESQQESIENRSTLLRSNSRRKYLGIGLGESNLAPITDNTNYEVTKSGGSAIHIHLGMDITQRIGAELHLGSLGESTLTSQGDSAESGTIGYSVGGVSALYFVGGNRQAVAQRLGLMGYARAGLGFLRNTATNIEFEQLNSVHFLVGLGAQYAMHRGFALRGELLSYDGDALAYQLALLYRFGGKKSP